MAGHRSPTGSFRDDFDDLIARLSHHENSEIAPIRRNPWEKPRPTKKAASCPAYHNQALFERAKRAR